MPPKITIVGAGSAVFSLGLVRDLCLATVKGQGAEGYRTAMTRLKEHLEHRDA